MESEVISFELIYPDSISDDAPKGRFQSFWSSAEQKIPWKTQSNTHREKEEGGESTGESESEKSGESASEGRLRDMRERLKSTAMVLCGGRSLLDSSPFLI